jgi:hypothetical protein
MAQLTQAQLNSIETDPTYQGLLRQAVIAQAGYWSGQDGVNKGTAAAAEEWFRKRQTAEKLLDQPAESIDRAYWASRSIPEIKNYDINGIGPGSTNQEICTAITSGQWEQLSIYTFTEESKRVLY